jgi:hypothetical protein
MNRRSQANRIHPKITNAFQSNSCGLSGVFPVRNSLRPSGIMASQGLLMLAPDPCLLSPDFCQTTKRTQFPPRPHQALPPAPAPCSTKRRNEPNFPLARTRRSRQIGVISRAEEKTAKRRHTVTPANPFGPVLSESSATSPLSGCDLEFGFPPRLRVSPVESQL